MKQKNYNKPTTNEIASAVSQLHHQLFNNQQAVYDAVEVITSYIEMNNDTKRFAEYRSAKLGSAIESSWKIVRICKYLKNMILTPIKKCCNI